MIEDIDLDLMKLAPSWRIQKKIEFLYKETQKLDDRKQRIEEVLAELEYVLSLRQLKEENDYYVNSKLPGILNKRSRK